MFNILWSAGELGDGLVAVKVVKKENAEDALKEVETMTAFNHQNILRMIGIAKNESKRLNLLVPLNWGQYKNPEIKLDGRDITSIWFPELYPVSQLLDKLE